MKHLLITAPFPSHLIDKIRAVSTGLTIEQRTLPNGRWPDDWTTEAEIYYALGAVPPLTKAPNLQWVQTHYAGVDSLESSELWHSDLLITTASGVHAANMAQYALTQILAWAHRVPNWFAYKQTKTWAKNRWDTFVPQELRGKTLGILGYGSIGRELARLAKPFGLKILVTKQDARQLNDTGFAFPGQGDPNGDLPDRIYPSEATRSMLAECDFVVITLPLTERTRHLIDEEMLKAMKPAAFLVNIGRGAIVNEADLVRGLKKGWLAGAGLDVFEEEPLPEDSPLWQLENVLLTPHISGFTPHYDDRATDIFAENLRRYLAGEPLLNQVNRAIGY
ncbi:MAG: D-2-hydroxyacid dehydrogenase [Ardenticatenaceae bacterium]|nr:D-2-hydroxyacid dehydrogenase [Anaerolineales bacterium]MCB8972563.1 D-2-hydroxyacid dehydrogenase [Ardenticatenaceae bacterium]